MYGQDFECEFCLRQHFQFRRFHNVMNGSTVLVFVVFIVDFKTAAEQQQTPFCFRVHFPRLSFYTQTKATSVCKNDGTILVILLNISWKKNCIEVNCSCFFII